MRKLESFQFKSKKPPKKRRRFKGHISPEELKKGCLAFEKNERRDATYKTATFLIQHFWGKPKEVAEGLGVLLHVWNSAFYRQKSFDYDLLENCIKRNQPLLDRYRSEDILSYSPSEATQIKTLFGEILDALRICEGKRKGI